MNSKAISPIISTIILILITITISISAYFWMIDIQETIQSDTGTKISDSAATDLTDFTILSVLCNSTTNEIEILASNNGVGNIQSGTAILVLTNIEGIELYTSINSSFQGLSQGNSATFEYESTYSLNASNIYIARLTLSNSKTRTRSCTAQE